MISKARMTKHSAFTHRLVRKEPPPNVIDYLFSIIYKARIRVKINLNSYLICILFNRVKIYTNHDHREEIASAIDSKMFLSGLRLTSALSPSERLTYSFWELAALLIFSLLLA